MAEIIHFTAKKELTAQKNLQNLITLSRDHLVVWADLPGFSWESSRWTNAYYSIRFTNYEYRTLHPSKKLEPHHLMHPDFVESAKAYLRYRHSVSPHRNLTREMAALRLLESVLREDMSSPDITRVDQRHFDRAIALLRLDKRRQSIASELLNILKTLADFYIVTSSAHYWTHPYVGTASYSYANGPNADAATKSSKLPDQDALIAIAEVFAKGHTQELEDVDTMITSITCLLLSAPMRIRETIRLRVDCLREDLDKNGKIQHYLTYWTPKIKEFTPKGVPETMASLTVHAVERLLHITEDSRRLARYMEGNPTKFYRHQNCPDVPDDQVLTGDQAAAALGLHNSHSLSSFIRRHTGRYGTSGYTLDSLWQLVLVEHRQLNPHFPYQEPVDLKSIKPLKMSESLMCFRRNQFGLRANTSPVLLAPFNRDHFHTRLKGSDRKANYVLCFFTRHGYESIKLKSHSLRHLLNRLARRSGLSIETITTWSSRATAFQTLTYLNDNLQETANSNAARLGLQQEQTHQAPITDDEAEIHSQGPFHRSRYGLCRRSWRAGPCNRFADCLNCSELLMCKGDMLATDSVAKDREHLLRTFNAAKVAMNTGERSASRWMKVAEPQIARLTQLLRILEDPGIPDGSPIELAGSANFSHEQSLVEAKAAASGVKLLDRNDLNIEYGSELLACLDLLRAPKNV